MPKFLLILFLLIKTAKGVCQAPNGFIDTPTITETSVGQARVGMQIAALRELYKGCTFKPIRLSSYGFNEWGKKPDAVMVTRDKSDLFIYFAARGAMPSQNKVAGLIALHSAYLTKQKIHVGSSSSALRAALPAVRVVPNMMLPAFQIAFAGQVEKPGLEYVFFKQGAVGKYVVADEPVKITATNAHISWIQVYPH